MSINGRSKCAVRGCAGKIEGLGNLCRDHAVAGAGVKVGDSTMIITVWYAERGTEYGTIVLNDYALGNLFGGESGFKAMLASQGFENVRLIASPEDLQLSEDPLEHINQTLGEWAGPWQTLYPWQKEMNHVS